MNDFVPVARLNDFGAGDRLSLEFDERAVLVFRIGSDIYAVEDVCSHDGQPLTEGAVFEGAVECPRHGARFDLKTGRPLCMPAVEPIRVYEVQISGDQILLKVP